MFFLRNKKKLSKRLERIKRRQLLNEQKNQMNYKKREEKKEIEILKCKKELKKTKPQSNFWKKILKSLMFLLKLFFFLAIPLLTLICSEFIQKWFLETTFRTIENNYVVFGFSYGILLLFFTTLFFVIWPLFWSIIYFILIFLFSIINHFKTIFLWDPFYPTDIFLHSWSMWQIASFTKFNLEYYIIFAFLFFLFLIAFSTVFFGKIKLTKKIRIISIFILLPINYYFFVSSDFRIQKLKAFTWLNAEWIAWRQKYNYDNNWFIFGFYINLGNLYVKKPDNYSKENVEKIYEKNKKDAQIQKEKLSCSYENIDYLEKKPDVIIILSEAFWDINKLPWVKYSTNPTINFENLKKNYTHWNLLSPTYWWKTAWVEYEILTGNLMKYLPFGSIPYQQYINKNIPSIVWEFKKKWYSTKAVHSYEKAFFNREKAYPYIWFDKFIWQEDMKWAWYKWPFISDKEFTNRLIKELEEKESKPKFIFGITMQNHFSYEWEKYKKEELDISINNPNLNKKDKNIITNYAQWIKDADMQLWRLVEYLKNRNKPTVLLFFGDHLWSLGEEYSSYIWTNYIKDKNENNWDKKDVKKMYSTEFIIWDNIGLPKKDEKYIGTSFLGNYILDLLNFENKDPYFNYISSIYKNCIASNSQKILMNKKYEIIDTPKNLANPDCQKIDEENSVLQYDILFGK